MVQPDKIIEENERFFQQRGTDLQASIFAAPRKDHKLLLFLKMDEASAGTSCLQILRALAANSLERRGLHLTSLQNQNDNYREKKAEKALFLNIFFTSTGLRKMPLHTPEWQHILDQMETKREDLDLIDPAILEPAYRSAPEIDLVFLLGHQKADALIRMERQLITQLFPRMQLTHLFSERGEVHREQLNGPKVKGVVVEHFGYADGGSNPCLAAWEYDRYRNGKQTMQNWSPVTTYRSFVVEEPFSSEQITHGSFLVYRKFEQDLGKFKEAITDLAQKAAISTDEAGALAFGRRKDGTSLEIPADQSNAANPNDFFYKTGGACPVFAHSRKVNPRETTDGITPHHFQDPNPILRRGITYGKRKMIYGHFAPDELPADPVGLLFLSYQDDITRYQKILQACREDEVDPILSDLDNSAGMPMHTISGLAAPHTGFGGFSSLRGGLNLFTPSLSFFKKLLVT